MNNELDEASPITAAVQRRRPAADVAVALGGHVGVVTAAWRGRGGGLVRTRRGGGLARTRRWLRRGASQRGRGGEAAAAAWSSVRLSSMSVRELDRESVTE
jgi:hypothetical protein